MMPPNGVLCGRLKNCWRLLLSSALLSRRQNMMQQLFLLFSGLVLATAGSQQYVAFDAASASSTHSAGNLAGSPAFAAQQALSAGSGYW